MALNIFPMSEQYEEYLIDEAKYTGYADSISFPETEEEIVKILRTLGTKKVPVTAQGGKTGIVGGSVPKGGHIMNLSHMNQVKDSWLEEDGTGRIVVQPGINLMDLKKEIDNRFRKAPQIWPADPTETSASIGGIVASGAQGISRILYGSSEKYVVSVRVCDYEGNIREYCGGQENGLDMVYGKEGITGIITEITLKLISKPESVWGIAFFFENSREAAEFIDVLKTALPESETAAVAAVEYVDRASIQRIEARKKNMTKIKELPDIRPEAASMIYVELHGSEEGIEELAESLMETAAEYGSDPDEAWAVSEEAEVEKLHVFRHAAAETANLLIEESHRKDKRITKLGIDMIMGERPFSEVLGSYEKALQDIGIEGCVFGHALENHLHVNLFPKNYEEYQKGVGFVRNCAKETREKAGKIIGEHGLGKLKKEILGDIVPPEYIEDVKMLKEKTDGANMLNRGNIFD